MLCATRQHIPQRKTPRQNSRDQYNMAEHTCRTTWHNKGQPWAPWSRKHDIAEHGTTWHNWHSTTWQNIAHCTTKHMANRTFWWVYATLVIRIYFLKPSWLSSKLCLLSLPLRDSSPERMIACKTLNFRPNTNKYSFIPSTAGTEGQRTFQAFSLFSSCYSEKANGFKTTDQKRAGKRASPSIFLKYCALKQNL